MRQQDKTNQRKPVPAAKMANYNGKFSIGFGTSIAVMVHNWSNLPADHMRLHYSSPGRWINHPAGACFFRWGENPRHQESSTV